MTHFIPAFAANPTSRRGVTTWLMLVGLILTLVGALAPTPHGAQAQSDDTDAEDATGQFVEILPMPGYVDPPLSDAMLDVIERAERDQSAAIVLQFDSPGALRIDEAALVDAILMTDIPVIAYVGPAGAAAEARGGAAALVAAADLKSLATDATLGPIDPVDQGRGTPLQATELGLVDNDVAALEEDVLTAEQAASAGITDLTADSLDVLLTDLATTPAGVLPNGEQLALDPEQVSVRFHGLGLLNRTLHAFATPLLVFLLLSIGLSVLAFEWFQPGFGVAGFAALIVLAIAGYGLTVVPATPVGFALLASGIGILAIDTALAGFGPLTLIGATAFAASGWWMYPEALRPSGWLIATLTFSTVFFFVVVITTVLRAQAGPGEDMMATVVGKNGVVRSVMNPQGHVFVAGGLFRARLDTAKSNDRDDVTTLAVGSRVHVESVDGPTLVVVPYTADAEAANGADIAEDADADADDSDTIDVREDAPEPTKETQ